MKSCNTNFTGIRQLEEVYYSELHHGSEGKMA